HRFFKAYCDAFKECNTKPNECSICPCPKNQNDANGNKSDSNGKNSGTTTGQIENGSDKSNSHNGKDSSSTGTGKDNRTTESEPEKPRRAPPAPFNSPPFPSGEYQGYPLIGVPAPDANYPLMKALRGDLPPGAEDSRVRAYGWVNA